MTVTPAIEITDDALAQARLWQRRAMAYGLDYLDAAYLVAVAANTPLCLGGEEPHPIQGVWNHTLNGPVRNALFARLVDEFRPAAPEV